MLTIMLLSTELASKIVAKMKSGAVLFVFLLTSTFMSFFFLVESPSLLVGSPVVYASMKGQAYALANGYSALGNATFKAMMHKSTSRSPDSAFQLRPSFAAKAALPSSFLVAACIVGLVALLGALLSIFWGRRREKLASKGRFVVERFWVID